MKNKHRDLNLLSQAFSLMETHYHIKWQRLERLYDCKHDAEFIKIAKEQERSHIFFPIAKSTCDIIDAIFSDAFFGNGNPIEIEKNEADEADIASCLNVLVEHYYKLSKPYNALNMAFSSASRFGLGAVLPYWDSSKEMPVTRFVPANKIAFDTDALTRDEIEYVAYKFKQSKQEVQKLQNSKFYDKISKRDLDAILGSNYTTDKEKYKRVEVFEVYTRKPDNTYICRTFIKNRLVREKDFKSCPIKHGYLSYTLPSMYDEEPTTSAAVGESMLEKVEHLSREFNMKRNQIIDIHEQIIDPYTMVGDEANIDPEDAGRIKGVVNVGDPKSVVRFPPTSTFSIESEVGLLQNDINDATAINGMQRGETSASDRRAASAMAMINANSSSRLTKMATTINDTLFNDWAESFVRDIYINTPNEVILQLFGSNPLGELGLRQELDYVVNVNFGKSINKDAKISELTMVLQMLNGREDANVMPILAEVLKLILGDAFDTNELFKGVLGTGGGATANGSDTEQAAGVVGDGSEVVGDTAGRSGGSTQQVAGLTGGAEYDAAAENQI